MGGGGGRLYKSAMAYLDRFVPHELEPLWNHPAGPKTVFFWAPTFKWGLVIAGIGDLLRPAHSVSLPQTAALFATGVIWSRYSLVITPVNYNLLSVNAFLATVQFYHLVRSINHHYFTDGYVEDDDDDDDDK